jgi:glycosyltransferase involved in cell wall biosynthesis
MKLAFVIFSLAEGGAERVMSVMASHWARKGETVSLVTLDATSSDAYPLGPQVHRVHLDASRQSGNFLEALANNFRRVRQLRGALRTIRPDIVICFMETTNVLTILATRGLGFKVVVMEHTNPEVHEAGRFWSAMRWLTYRFADRVGVLTERSRPWAERLADPAAVFVMPNAIKVEVPADAEAVDLRAWVGLPSQARVVVSMGRLAPEKGFDLLIQAFAQLANTQPEFHLVIMGEGPDRSALEQAREASGMLGRIHLPGRVSNPTPYLRQCDLFVMSSRYEGFPMALCEAMACGLPVISFDCPTGPGEIIRDRVDGILVPSGDFSGLIEALRELMNDPTLRQELGARGPEVLERFSEEKIMGKWERLLSELAGK